METTPWATVVTTTGGIWMTEETPEASMVPRTSRTISSGETTSVPLIAPAPGGTSAGLVAGVVIGVLALLLLAAGVAFFVLKKRGIIFNRDDAAMSTERTDPERDNFLNLLGKRPGGNRSQGDQPPVPTTGPPKVPDRRKRPAGPKRKQEDPLPIPDDDGTYASLLEDSTERSAHTRSPGDPLPLPDDNTYIDLLQKTPTNNRSPGDPLPLPDDNTYYNLQQETKETPTHNRSQKDPLPTPDDNTYQDLLEETRERPTNNRRSGGPLLIPDNNTYTSLEERPDNNTSQRNQPIGDENTYQNIPWPGRAQQYVNATQLPHSPHVQQSETTDGAYEMANLGGSAYENCPPVEYVNTGVDGNVAETSYVNQGNNADNLYEDVQPENTLYSNVDPTYAN